MNKIIVATNYDLKNMDEEARLSIIQQATGIPLKSEMGKIIGKVIEFELVNPSTVECKIKGVLFDEH